MNNTNIYSYIFIGIYLLGIITLVILSKVKKQTLESFAIGGRNASPIFVGLSLAANLNSAATFVVNPGLVYLYGLSGFLGYAIAAPLGMFLGLIFMSKKFRTLGDNSKILTVPSWIGEKYKSKTIKIFFGIISLLQITFMVLIVVGVTIVLSTTLNASIPLILFLLLAFTIAYISIGGASIHIVTNSFQGIIMLITAILLLISGPLFANLNISEIFNKLYEIDPNLVSITNPKSLLFRDIFEVFIANFLVGVAIICQPHLISKALYLRSERDVNKYLTTAIIVGTIFFMVLFTGIYARGLLTGEVLPPDQSMAAYINHIFPPPLIAFVNLGILAAGFSTLEGLFIALSTIFSVDILKTTLSNRTKFADEEKLNSFILKVTRIFIVILGIIIYFFSLAQIKNPSLSVAIFGQNGVYGLFVATFWPIFLGMFKINVKTSTVFIAAIMAFIIHFGMYYLKITHYSNNPAVPASFALIISGIFVAFFLIFQNQKKGMQNV